MASKDISNPFIMKRFAPLLFPVIAFLTGILTVFSFAPYGVWGFQILCLAILSGIIICQEKTRHAFFCGWCYGSASFGAGLYWMFISLHVYGGMNALPAATGIALLAMFMGLLPASACLLTHLLMKRFRTGRYLTAMMLFPAFWTVFEWLRGWILSGLPWLTTGYAFTDSPMAGYAPVLGVFGISLMVSLAAGTLTCLSIAVKDRSRNLMLVMVVVFVLLLSAGQSLRQIEWTTVQGEPIKVRLLQGNIAQEAKFNPRQIYAMLDQYASMITRQPADVIVTPETAVPIYPQNLPAGYLDSLLAFVDASGSRLALGIPLADSRTVYTNSLVVLSPKDSGSDRLYRYNKHHLVPFGEFVPMGFRWFVNMMHIPLGDFKRGDLIQQPFPVKGQWILPNICYEDIFGEEIAARLRDEHASGRPVASILLNISNIAWFGDTIALPQHLQISRMRSLETGRPMLRATNTGTTAFIDEYGEVVQQLPPYVQGELSFHVTGTQGMTPYILFGNTPTVILSVLLIILAGLAARFRQKRL